MLIKLGVFGHSMETLYIIHLVGLQEWSKQPYFPSNFEIINCIDLWIIIIHNLRSLLMLSVHQTHCSTCYNQALRCDLESHILSL